MRDEALPHAYRLHALGSCIQLSQPIGFNATWSYLESKVGLPWRNIEFLGPAIELLEAERSAHLRLVDEYAAVRRGQKAAGLRFPRRQDVTPRDPKRWHGDEHEGAIHALTTWRRLRHDAEVETHPHGRLVVAAIDQVVGLPRPAALDSNELQRVLDCARRQVHVVGWEVDRTEYRVAWVLLYLLGQLHLIDNGSPTIGSPWNFVTPPDD